MPVTAPEAYLSPNQRALDLFTDRVDLLRAFCARLNAPQPAVPSILYFHGVGGTGRSLLLDYLKQHACMVMLPEEWGRASRMPDAEFQSFVMEYEAANKAITASLNFDDQPIGDARPRDAFYALLMLRRQLAKQGIRMPLFDNAAFWFLYCTEGDIPKERLKSLFPDGSLALIQSTVDLLASVPLANFLISLLDTVDNYSDKHFTLFIKQWGFTKAQLLPIHQRKPQPDLLAYLPELFAEELNAVVAARTYPMRVVLFFDTHEALFSQAAGAGGLHAHAGDAARHVRDEWLRVLLTNLKPSDRIIPVFAGREPPEWNNAVPFSIPNRRLDCRSVEHLAAADADAYLRNAGIDSADLRNAIVRYTEGHAFYLYLAEQAVHAAKAKGVALHPDDFAFEMDEQQRDRELVNRFMKYLDSREQATITAISAARSFDLPLFLHLMERLRIAADRTTFRQITGYSFFSPLDATSGATTARRYRMHRLLQRELQDDDITREAHAILEAYYRTLTPDAPALAEAIYHLSFLDRARATAEWLSLFEEWRKHSRWSDCQALVDIAELIFDPSTTNWGDALYHMGGYYAALSLYDVAVQSYQDALAAYGSALKLAPDHVYAHNNRGIALSRLGELQATLGRHDEAVQSYQDALAAFGSALKLAPDDVVAHNNRGNALLRLGELQATLGRHNEAVQSYQQALAAYGNALKLAPDDVDAHNNRGLALLSLGELQATLGRHDEAAQSYQDALAAFGSALKLAPDYVYAHNNRGNALRSLGGLQATLGRHDEAVQSYQDALAAFGSALKLAPDDVDAHNNRGIALSRLGELQARLGRHDEAVQSYQDALAAYGNALRLAPDDVDAHNNRGIALRGLGVLQARLGRHDEAVQSYQDALAAFDRALKLAPDYVGAHNNRGLALRGLGELQARLGRHDEAVQSYQDALAAYGNALKLAPDDVAAHNNRGLALLSLGELQATLGRRDEAVRSYREALAAFDRVLTLAPGRSQVKQLRDAVARLLDDLNDAPATPPA